MDSRQSGRGSFGFEVAMTTTATKLFGIDGCRGGWVIAKSEEDSRAVTFEVANNLESLFSQSSRGGFFIAIDIPIGLSEDSARACDQEARKFLGSKGSSVFPVPCRPALQAAAPGRYREACNLNFQASGRRLSKQSHAILPKIAHVDALMKPAMQQWIREAHPELAFATMNHCHFVSLNKRTIEGQRKRLQLLRNAGLAITATDLVAERLRLGRANVKPDDLLDALACLTVARRIARGHATRFPLERPEERDCCGLRMEIWG
ncbi:MAG: DUF429 domain-containing protein [Acidobacteria bacterium]|nr:MAG: DUF429 domain-containing protein [Acidobacteriota bacterium]